MNAVSPLVPDSSSVLEHLSTAILILDNRVNVVYLNPAAEDLFSTSQRMASQLRLQDIAVNAGEKTLLDCVQHPAAEGHSYTYHEITITPPGTGESRTVNTTITPLYQRTLRNGFLIEFNRVDRILRIAEEEQLRTQHLAACEIARGLAHEINNPLGGLRGAAQLLERELPESSREYTRIIINEADRLQTLVKNMLGPRTLPKFSSVNIHEIIDRVITLIRAEGEPSLEITLDFDPSIPPIRADQDHLIQAILNIVRNACQAVHGEGHITITTRVVRRFTIGQQFHRLVLKLDINDNGPGIPQHKLKQIFYPMVTGRSEGTGLGLTIAQSLISLHNGLIECKSEAGNTTFSILVPYAEHS